jgi:hypothetical protein
MRRRHNRAVKRNNIIQATGVIMDSAELKRNLAYADLIRDLAHAREARVKLFDAIVRVVQRREATGPSILRVRLKLI